MNGYKIILASESPRRRELFSLITPDFTSVSSDVDESEGHTLPAVDCCRTLARLKCETAAKSFDGCCIIGCDTVVEINGLTLGKPRDDDDARVMLKMLSGETHTVYTGVHIICPDGTVNFAERTEVTFSELNETEIESYIVSGEPFGKAGSYGIQGGASKFISGISGDYFNVVGLPVSHIYRELKRLGAIMA